MKAAAFAGLLFLSAGVGLHAADENPSPQTKKVIRRPAIQEPAIQEEPAPIEPGGYLLVEVEEQKQGGQRVYPTARPVTLARDADGNLTLEFMGAEGKIALEVMETSLGFQIVDKDPKRIRTTTYFALRSKGPIQGRFYTISSVSGLTGQGTFTLQPRMCCSAGMSP